MKRNLTVIEEQIQTNDNKIDLNEKSMNLSINKDPTELDNSQENNQTDASYSIIHKTPLK